MAFIGLHDENNREILVNTDNITYIDCNYNSSCRFINFVDSDNITVRETFDEIMELIKNSGR